MCAHSGLQLGGVRRPPHQVFHRSLFVCHVKNRKSMCNFSGIISRVQLVEADGHAARQSMCSVRLPEAVNNVL